MDKNRKEKHKHLKAVEKKINFVERDEDEMPVFSGAVLHVLSSNGLTSCDKSGIIQKGKIIKNNDMGKKDINSFVLSQANIDNRQNRDSCYCKNMNGLDAVENGAAQNRNDQESGTSSKRQTRKIQNGGSDVTLNGFNSSPDSSPVKPEACACSKTVNGDVQHFSNETKTSPKSPAVRPKSMSWSRMVKQRKENKMKERNGKGNKKSHKRYIYPELCSSSEESSDDNIKSSDKITTLEGHCDNNDRKMKSINNQSLKLYGNNLVSKDGTEKLSLAQYMKPVTVPVNGENGHAQNLPTSQPDLTLLRVAPLAVPEDSDTGQSSVSSSEGKMNGSVIENNITRSMSQENIDHEQVNTVEEGAIAGPSSSVDHREIERNILPLYRNPSIDSLEEVGDYIETDFPSKASRLLFQSSSRSSSPSTDEEDEGYVVNKAKDKVLLNCDEVEQSFDPSCPQNPPSHNVNPDHLKLKILEHVEQNSPSVQRPNFDSVNHAAHRIARLSSGAGSESEKGGVIGSDSSYVYTPETDYQEFIDSDLPSSEANNHYAGNSDRDYAMPPLGSYAEEYLDTDSNLGASNHLVGAEGGATNNLNLEGRCYPFDYIDSNMEVYDPHCDQPDDDNYLLRVIYKHEKVPIANFQNSESNKQEKIFCKLSLDRDNRSLSASSEEEENALHHFCRDTPGLASSAQQTNNDCSDCMGVEDLENLTHALQNAVIMHLPSRLEESSEESCEDPIYEEIDSLDSFLSTSDNSLQVVEEEPCHGPRTKVNTLPKYERRRRKGHRGSDVDKVMIWNEYEAYVLQVKQIGTSACGPTAVLNILKAFDYQVDKEEVCKKVTTNLRMEAAPVPYYLFSRYNAGTTADSLIDGITKLTKGTIKGRFFHFYPARKVQLLKWLGYWMRKGAVPLATLNLQRGVKPGWTIPDAWHHQMVYGVSSKGVHLTNPLEIVPEEIIMEQLTSDSVLLIRRQDVVNRFRDWAPLNEFLKKSDDRWQTMNVLGQVVNVLREACTALSHQGPRYRAQLTSHITIPAAYKAGITLFVRQNTEVCQELFNAPDLELMNPEETEEGY
ncbi:unnamed protein product [Mytilus edulis]|uniref:Uncharacterized protein n=1 Tax=Mytilus edulis TaxID=6550 RepID=A0A8S3U9Y1_MYTED|nr:unnamed protein product [Mytilus edulis]